MKTLSKILCAIFIVASTFALTACEKSNMLDVSVYCQDSIKYELNDKKKTEGKFDLSSVINSNSDLNNYTRIQITTKQDWTYGLELERVEFDLLLSESADVDIDITVSNLENGDHFNESKNTYYYKKTISINNQNTTVKLDINDIVNGAESVISLEIDKACYTSHPDLKIGIGNLKMYGQHTPVNY